MNNHDIDCEKKIKKELFTDVNNSIIIRYIVRKKL